MKALSKYSLLLKHIHLTSHAPLLHFDPKMLVG